MAEVSEFACGRTHPQLGAGVTCARKRWHAGDHRAESPDALLKVWSDEPATPFSLELDEQDELVGLEVTPARIATVWAVALAVAVAAWGIPAALLLWRAAL